MATTFKIKNGDVTLGQASGRPLLLGNTIGENDAVKAHSKAVQDIQGSLSIERIKSGAGAGIVELIGMAQEVGFVSASVLIGQRIRDMFSSLLKLQRVRPNTRPRGERFSRITLLQVIQDPQVRTAFRFRLDVRTNTNSTIIQSGTLGG